MTLGTRTSLDPDPATPSAPPGRSLVGLGTLTVALVVLAIGQNRLMNLFGGAAVGTWSTVFVSVIVQALPFLVLGVALSAAITAFVPASAFRRLLPSKPALAVPVAGAAGALLPGCECASVPVAAGLMGRGVPAAAVAVAAVRATAFGSPQPPGRYPPAAAASTPSVPAPSTTCCMRAGSWSSAESRRRR